MNIVDNIQKKTWKKPILKMLSITKTKEGRGDNYDLEAFTS